MSVCMCKMNVLFSNEIQTFPVSGFLSTVAVPMMDKTYFAKTSSLTNLKG